MYRPPAGIPRRERGRWRGWVASLLAHLLLLAALVLPLRDTGPDLGHREGASGAGPAGGGGGGLGDDAPRLRFVRLAPAPPAAPAPVRAAPVPVAPPPQPVSRPVPAPVPSPAPAAPAAASAQQPSTTAAPGAGSGLGLGRTGGAGSGPGSGGGVGSGVGTGRGSATGPGTGGGADTTYPPTPRQFFLPPLPAPRSLRGFRLVAWFDVDSTGRAALIRFTPSPDGSYNNRLRETLLALRFRPAVRADGRPVRDTVDVQFLF